METPDLMPSMPLEPASVAQIAVDHHALGAVVLILLALMLVLITGEQA